MIKNTITLLTLSLVSLAWGQQSPKFASTPSLSPDGKTTYFSYNGDIWQAPTAGGEALRITALEGSETNPRVSPDGKWLAFSSDQYGNRDVFLMPLTGGQITQLTYHQASEDVESWSWDSKTIYFTSNANNNFGSYAIDINGGTPKPLFTNYFNNTNGLVVTPAGEYLFTSSMESASQTTRKRYKGENNPDILGYNPTTKAFKSYTDYEGKDFNPTVDRNGKIYFISDENNGNYNLYTFDNGKKVALTNFDTSIKKPYVSADGSKVVFEKDYMIYVLDTATKSITPLATSVNTNKAIEKEQSYAVEENMEYFDVSPDAKKIAFVSRGILFVSDIEGKFVQAVSDGKERVMEVKWLKDNKTLLYSQTYKGYQNWFKRSADGKGTVTQLTSDNRNNRDITLNKEMTKAVYLSGRDEVRLLDLTTYTSKVIVKDEIWAFQNSIPSFSPNGEYVLFTAKRNFEEDIFVHHIAKNETINLTNTGVAESSPYWSPSGKYIYFMSDRLNPSYPLGMQNPSIYRFSVDWQTDAFKSDQFDKLFVEKKEEDTKDTKKKDKKKKQDDTPKVKSIKINTEGLLDRIEQVSDRFGNQYNPIVFADDKKEVVFYNTNQENGKGNLYKTVYEDFEDNKSEKVFDKRANQLLQRDKKVYALISGNIYSFELSKGKPEQIKIKHSFTKNLADEFNQMYYETWAGVEENFYDETFHGIDWDNMKEQFAQYLPDVNSRNDLRILLNDMLGELGSSHLGFNSSGSEEKTKLSYRSYETGIVFNTDKPYQVERIVRKSPAYATDIDIKPGDVLTKVNGQKVDDKANRDTYFAFPNRQEEISLTFNRGGKEINTKLHPISFGDMKSLLYDEWIFTNKQRVNKLSDNRIAYTYMKNMTSPELDRFLLDMVEQEANKEGVILDLRYNTGGNVHDKVLNFLSQRPYLQWKYREGKLTVQSNFTPSGKPIVLLINESSLSDAEMTAAGFKALKLGKIIGQETYRWIIFTSGKSLVDGSSYRLPSWGTYTLDGQNLEKTGVAPDIYVKNTFVDRLNDNDPQLERAVQEILNDIK
ncbi:PDZ domain-containing protein [Myroides odoratimimus]|uniref:S41 family peptidase n=1 Tax=Myroides odoratimimus TaxID=76832 RepID=UPI00103FBA0D|nr:S41 family peptidase [Myroides odoratimimus]MDM1495626.1 PD40 domain-containing protein [Myroides odoratimimus]QBK75897.1 PDZ domain-containing protein [Myroides odoratimimus]